MKNEAYEIRLLKQFPLVSDQLVHKSIDGFDVVPQRTFGTDVEKSFQFPEGIDIAPKNLSTRIIKGFHESDPFFARFLQAIQFHAESNFENGVQSAPH